MFLVYNVRNVEKVKEKRKRKTEPYMVCLTLK